MNRLAGVLLNLSCTQVSSGNWDNGYDIWFNSDPNPLTNQTGSYLELMVWLSDHNAPPTLAPVASNVPIGGRTYNIYMSGTEAIYQLTAAVSSVTNRDLGPIVYDALNTRHYVQSNWYLIDIEAGFEIWQGGNGLRVNSFSG